MMTLSRPLLYLSLVAVFSSIALAVPSAGSGSCTVFGTGPTNIGDVQLVINEALGVTPPVNDLNSDGVVNATDIQIVIKAALACASTSSGTSAVSHLTVQSGNGQVACVCYTSTLHAYQPIIVKATDVNGNPVSGATVTWSLTSGQMTLASPTSITDGTGLATEDISLLIYNNFSSTQVPYLVATIQAASNNSSVTFTETQSLLTAQGTSVIEADPPQFGGAELVGVTLSSGIGTTLSTPIQVRVAGLGVASNGVANVSVRLLNEQSAPTLTCANQAGYADPGSVLSDSLGNTNCYPAFSGSGTGTFYILIGGVAGVDISSAYYLEAIGPFSFTSVPGAPAAVQIISGNNQVAGIGQPLNPMIARLVDGTGNVIPGQMMVWSVVPAGAASLDFANPVTDSNGEISETGSLDILASAGAAITVAVQSNPNVSATFHETIPGALTAMNKIGGDNQSAQEGANFANPLVVQLVNASGPVEGFAVKLLVSGPVSLPEGATVYTNANGEASISVTAGATTGTATVTAVAGALTQAFTLTVR